SMEGRSCRRQRSPRFHSRTRSERTGSSVSALLALLAAIAVALVLAVDSGSPGTTAAVAEQEHALRSAGGVEESAVAATVAARQSAAVDESRIAASIGTSTGPTAGSLEESQLGHAALMGPAPEAARSDQSHVAAAIAG